jgi:hypothetical protein
MAVTAPDSGAADTKIVTNERTKKLKIFENQMWPLKIFETSWNKLAKFRRLWSVSLLW